MFFIGHRTYEGLDEELIRDVDDKDYDDANQFIVYHNSSNTPQGLSKRMKQSPITKKWVPAIDDLFSAICSSTNQIDIDIKHKESEILFSK